VPLPKSKKAETKHAGSSASKSSADAHTLEAAAASLTAAARRIYGNSLPFLGTAFIASVGLYRPPYLATNIQAGSNWLHLLESAGFVSNLMAMLIQTRRQNSALPPAEPGRTLPSPFRE